MGTAAQPARISRSWLKPLAGAVGTAIGVIAGALAILQYCQSIVRFNLGGDWEITNTIQQTSLRRYQGLKIGYHLFLRQDGTAIAGEGEKWSENGQTLAPKAHTPIQIRGSISGDKVTATFRENGTERKTAGEFTWTVKDNQSFAGNFSSTAADSSGSSSGRRIEGASSK